MSTSTVSRWMSLLGFKYEPHRKCYYHVDSHEKTENDILLNKNKTRLVIMNADATHIINKMRGTIHSIISVMANHKQIIEGYTVDAENKSNNTWNYLLSAIAEQNNPSQLPAWGWSDGSKPQATHMSDGRTVTQS